MMYTLMWSRAFFKKSNKEKKKDFPLSSKVFIAKMEMLDSLVFYKHWLNYSQT